MSSFLRRGSKRRYPFLRAALVLLVGSLLHPLALQACGSDDMKAVGTELYYPLAYDGERPTRAQLADLGRKLFADPSLSASGKLACASCHSPDHAYGPPGKLMTPLGGVGMDRSGFRNTPSLSYVHSPVAFTEHFVEPDVTGGQDDEGPTGGRTWDGRVNTGHEQALMPLLDPNEMANASREALVERVRHSNSARVFSEVVSPPGSSVFDDPDAVIGWLSVAIEAFEQTPADFHPFTSKYDAYLRDQVQLSPQEQRGLALFNNIKKGNCATCHPSGMKTPKSRFPLFTDFGYAATGAPRNAALPANAKPDFFDLGLCGPLRHDLQDKPGYCGMFRTPSLRNVALRKRYFHNGVFGSLREVLSLYVTRDIAPGRWYPRAADGHVVKFNDLPPQYQANVNHEVPFAPLPGGRARLNAAEIDDVLAFLGTLTDGYRQPVDKSAVHASCARALCSLDHQQAKGPRHEQQATIRRRAVAPGLRQSRALGGMGCARLDGVCQHPSRQVRQDG